VRILLIANPTAGQGRVRWIAGFLQSALERYSAEVTLILTGGPRDAAVAAGYALESGRFDRVVAAGGDGTVNQIVNALVGTPLPLAILPLGTANSLAREIGLPLDLVRAAKIAVQGPPIRVDVGRTGGSYFLLEVSAGFDAEVVSSVRKPQKRWLGAGAYIFNGLSILRTHEPFDLTLTLDGEVMNTQANMVIGANTATYVFGFRLARDASIHDGLIDLCVLEAGVHPFRWQVMAGLCSRLGPRVGAVTYHARKIRVESSPPAAVQIDGDPAGTTPIDIECVPGALALIVPERYARRVNARRDLDPALLPPPRPAEAGVRTLKG